MPAAHAPRRLSIAARPSTHGRWCAEHVRAQLAALYPGTTIGHAKMPAGDDRRITSSATSRGKSVCNRALHDALADGRADIVVHALKDVALELPPGFVLAAILARDDARDAFVSRRAARLSELPPNAIVGTASLRRAAQLRARRPDVTIDAVHRDADARLRDLDGGRCDALIIAVARLKRMGHASRIASLIGPDECLPAPGQGALAIECRADRPDLINALAPLADRATTLATIAERAFARALSGGGAALAAYAEWEEGALWLRGLVASSNGHEVLRGEQDAVVDDGDEAAQLGRAVADDLLARGAARLVAP